MINYSFKNINHIKERDQTIKLFILQKVKFDRSIMIHTVGFQSHILSSVTENIDKFVEDMTKQHGSTFRLIDIKFAATTKPLESTRKQSDVDYSALIIYEI